jgi:DNA-binding transcriptional LysR family regulator
MLSGNIFRSYSYFANQGCGFQIMDSSKYEFDYIPIELLLAVVAIVDSGSFTKASELLGLTQSAISAQVKRLQRRTGTDLFAKSGGGLILTERGKIIDRYARRILEMETQLILLSGARRASQSVRLGLPVSFVPFMLPNALKTCAAALGDLQFQVQCGSSKELLVQLANGYLDAAVVISASRNAQMAVAWDEQIVWVRSPDLHVSPGTPIPYISWPDSDTDRVAFAALERSGLHYTVSFSAVDFNARVAAARAALGYMLLPARAAFGSIQFAREFFLPQIGPTRGGVCIRKDFDTSIAPALVKALESVARPVQQETRETTTVGS